MRAWSTSQVKHSASNDNPYEGDELLAMQADRQKQPYPLGDRPLVVLTRGIPEFQGPNAGAQNEARQKEQAELATRARAGKQIVSARSGHHIDLEDPELVAQAVRDVVGLVKR
jgi:hypothetical protein